MMAKQKSIHPFKCVQCGSDKLVFHKHVRCQMPVEVGTNGRLEYGLTEYYEDDWFVIGNYFGCENGHRVVDDEGAEAETEEQMLWHLEQTFERRKEMYDNYLSLIPHDEYREDEERCEPCSAPKQGLTTFQEAEFHPFTCEECGSSNLAYSKYVKCVKSVIVYPNGTFDYLPSQFDEADYAGACYGYCCENGHMIIRFDSEIRDEEALISYLRLTPEERKKEYEDYVEQVASSEDLCDESGVGERAGMAEANDQEGEPTV